MHTSTLSVEVSDDFTSSPPPPQRVCVRVFRLYWPFSSASHRYRGRGCDSYMSKNFLNSILCIFLLYMSDNCVPLASGVDAIAGCIREAPYQTYPAVRERSSHLSQLCSSCTSFETRIVTQVAVSVSFGTGTALSEEQEEKGGVNA